MIIFAIDCKKCGGLSAKDVLDLILVPLMNEFQETAIPPSRITRLFQEELNSLSITFTIAKKYHKPTCWPHAQTEALPITSSVKRS